MSTRATIWLSPEFRGKRIHVYRDVILRKTFVEVGGSYGWFTQEWPRFWRNRWREYPEKDA